MLFGGSVRSLNHIRFGKITAESCVFIGDKRMSISGKRKRVEVSIPYETYELISQAAERRGETLRGFITSCAYEAALKDASLFSSVWQPVGVTVLSRDSGDTFAQAYEESPAPNEAVKKARQMADAIVEIQPDKKDLF